LRQKVDLKSQQNPAARTPAANFAGLTPLNMESHVLVGAAPRHQLTKLIAEIIKPI
jgi:hypothetical protein